jgi:transposase InsO family protein
MRMPYTTNTTIPEVRMKAVLLVRKGWSTRKVARHFGFSQGCIVKWVKRAPRDGRCVIPTQSSAPKRSPRSLPKEVVAKIIAARMEHRRCSEVIHEYLRRDGIVVSLSSVKRVLGRYSLLRKRSPWKKTRKYPPLPDVEKPGDLVEFDTVHLERPGRRKYVYTALDVYSRYGFAMVTDHISCRASAKFLRRVVKKMPIRVVQTDNGPEWSIFFTDVVQRLGMFHRHIHPRSPNENGHLERFNRTIQEETLALGFGLSSSGVLKYLTHYNEKRLHIGLKFKTPKEMLK